MRADQFGGCPRADRRQSQSALQGEINPVGQRGFQLGKCFPLGFASGDQTAKTWNARDETFVLAEECDLRELESLSGVFFHRLHDCTVLETKAFFKA